VPARLIQMDWTLLLDDRETVNGRVDREVLMEPGVVEDIPIGVRLDLADSFDSKAVEQVPPGMGKGG
jgi:hypothetical protein